jgi:hypothetical protein
LSAQLHLIVLPSIAATALVFHWEWPPYFSTIWRGFHVELDHVGLSGETKPVAT